MPDAEKSLQEALNKRLLRGDVCRMNPRARGKLAENLEKAGGDLALLEGLFHEASDRRNPAAQVAEWLRLPPDGLRSLLQELREIQEEQRARELMAGERRPLSVEDAQLREHLAAGGTAATFREEKLDRWAYALITEDRLDLDQVVDRFAFAGLAITKQRALERARAGRRACNGTVSPDKLVRRRAVRKRSKEKAR